MYAILDIETTGGQFNEEGITEIAIYKFDGHEIVDQFISLVNPEIPIQPFVIKLTGINNEMLKTAPKFFEVAKRILEITQDCVLVAHNASFDYRILKTEFRRLGYQFSSKNLCTVELSQKLLPEQPSHSLGKLVRALGIPMSDRHRATGDALATVKLFKILLEKDLEKIIVKKLIKSEVESGISPKLQDLLENIPSKTGIYYIHNQKGTLIYIGKSRNIKKQLNQHFIGNSTKSKKLQTEVFTITYDETGSELIAILKESEEIKINKPKYNSTLRKNIFNIGLYSEKDSNGYLNLKLQKIDRRKKEITSFISLTEGNRALENIVSKYELSIQIQPEEYNARVQELINKNSFENQNMIIVDRGRTISERSAILIENGVYQGYAFYDLNYQIHNIQILKNIIVPMQSNGDTNNIIQSHIRKTKNIKIIKF